MDLVKTGIGITKTIKNVSRLKEILTVFGKNGFDEFIIKSNLHSRVPGLVLPKKKANLDKTTQKMDLWESIGYRLRCSFEELGPSFVKLGQLLSTREDIFDPGLIKELKKLQDNASGMKFDVAQKIIERNLEQSIDEVFSKIEPKPIGKASIGVVYKGTLLNGEDVVIKVRRPNIQKLITNDFQIISFLVGQLERASEEVKLLGISRAINDFFTSIKVELNFLIEAQNCEKLKHNIEKVDEKKIFFIPKIFKEYSTDEVMVMEFVKGRPFNTLTSVDEVEGLEEKLMEAVKIFIHNMLVDGFFHADLHGGNFFLLDDGRIGLIDFGLMGVLGKKSRVSLVAILFALLTNDFENLAYEFLDVADYEEIPNHALLSKDIQDAVAPYIGLDINDVDATLFVNSIVGTLTKHRLYLPREWFIIFRALMTLDGVGKSLGININTFSVIDGQIQQVAGELFSKEAMMEEAIWIGRDVLNSVRIIPRQLRWFLQELSKNHYAFDINLKGVEKQMKSLSRVIAFVGLQVVSSTLFFSGVFLLSQQGSFAVSSIPTIIWIFWSISFMIFIQSLMLLRKF